jgi:hypothetical protein
LHLFGTKAAAVEKNRKRVAGEGAVGKHIDLHHGEFLYRSRHALDFTVRSISQAQAQSRPDAIT